ncbi:uncharacterized protein LOC100164688 isoform X1 [Acyrthosiphon pisum]|uniref:Uncharacterized protein n=2 Tax=Acyrthosiphon pisum TaxID=7029 RepID=A0A8R2A3N5_ACYPI|nr:uncharacterized protein LOC100164688 isoform X1 [Acyrthosiphon pisum]|eukprot:XP_001942585.3 PREDICTED: uncharacterized protein LOC100164688 isoform X1 [Acyrthosiphon pisum]
MSNSNEIEKNFETLKDLSTTMSKAFEQLEQQQSKLEKNNKRLNDTNDMLLEMTKKQRLMVGSSEPSREEITNRFRVSIYKKLAALEKQLLQNQTAFTDDINFDDKDPKKMLKLKVQIHSLIEENRSLRDQLSDFQDLYDRVMAEIRSANSKTASSQTTNNQQQGNSAMYASPTTTSSLDQDDLQPLQVNVIDSDVDGLKDK